MHRLRFAFLAALFWSATAHATTILVVRPPNPSAQATATLARLHGELLSVGLDVAFADGPAHEPKAWQALATQHKAQAALDLISDGTSVAVEVWVVDPARRVAHVAVEPNTEDASGRLAIRAVEVLRSSLLEAGLSERERDPKDPKSPESPNTPAPPRPRFAVEAGAAALASLDGVGPAIFPMVRFDWAARSSLAVHATLAGLGTRPTIAGITSQARVAQQFAVVGASHAFATGGWLRPYAAFAVGALHTSMDGQADAPKQGHTVDQWSLLFDGCVGAVVPVSERTFVNLAGHAHLAQPYVAIHVADEAVATSGRPNLLLTLTIGVWL